MSVKHPIITVTGSSGAGTSTVQHTFNQIFRREGVKAATIEGDAFHKFNRMDMKKEFDRQKTAGNDTFSYFSTEANILGELADIFKTYGKTGNGKGRYYVHNDDEAKIHGTPSGTFTDWAPFEDGTDVLFYEGLHGAIRTDEINVADHVDLKIGVVPVINLEWIQKHHRDKNQRGYSTEAITDVILRRMHDYVNVITPQFSNTDINFQRVPIVDTSNPFIARWIPTAGESLVVIRFADPSGIDFSYLTRMINNSFMSRANSIVVPGEKMDLAMQLILTPLIHRLIDNSRKAR